MHQLYDFAQALNVTIEYANLEHLERDGDYHHPTRSIRLQHGMVWRLERSVLAHELAHAVFEDEPSMFGPANAKMERRADEWAALRLITPEAYRDAERVHHGHIPSMAQDLGVIEDLALAYRGLLARLGDSVYLAPKMGAGQWARKIGAA